jgi:uncharacterized protein GlcG (DUF336 family)
MRTTLFTTMMLGATLALAGAAHAQQPPDYGMPITADQAKAAAAAAIAEAQKNGWKLAIAVVEPSGDLVYFEKMANTQYGSVQIALHKAKAAATFRRPTKVFEERVAAGGAGIAAMTLDGMIASEGGVPIMVGGKIIGAIGASGALGSQDGMAATAGSKAVK